MSAAIVMRPFRQHSKAVALASVSRSAVTSRMRVSRSRMSLVVSSGRRHRQYAWIADDASDRKARQYMAAAVISSHINRAPTGKAIDTKLRRQPIDPDGVTASVMPIKLTSNCNHAIEKAARWKGGGEIGSSASASSAAAGTDTCCIERREEGRSTAPDIASPPGAAKGGRVVLGAPSPTDGNNGKLPAGGAPEASTLKDPAVALRWPLESAISESERAVKAAALALPSPMWHTSGSMYRISLLKIGRVAARPDEPASTTIGARIMSDVTNVMPRQHTTSAIRLDTAGASSPLTDSVGFTGLVTPAAGAPPAMAGSVASLSFARPSGLPYARILGSANPAGLSTSWQPSRLCGMVGSNLRGMTVRCTSPKSIGETTTKGTGTPSEI
mmetsp:Transcript_877/g.3053  ORF Transcript_877/g.3053 Transcript_877/m.3053 type:complete len:386 (-) Transcript_877:95-1252(-)|eukprot:scaffold186026_cov28-Tisochrysis_lutea.AAC.2